jgi:hypothetical protein
MGEGETKREGGRKRERWEREKQKEREGEMAGEIKRGRGVKKIVIIGD